MADVLIHDAKCDKHERDLIEAQTTLKNWGRDLDSIVERFQKFIDEGQKRDIASANMAKDIASIAKDVDEIKDILKDKFALRDEFITLRNQVWAGIGLLVVGIGGAFVKWIVSGGLATGVK